MRVSEAEKYLRDVQSGKVVACKRMKQLADMMLSRFRDGYKKWHFDIEKAERPVQFIEKFCMLPSGKLGEPFVLEPYERAVIEIAFGFVDDDGIRQFQEVLVIWARKQGKTSLGAAIELYMLIADGEGAPQIYNVATSKDQASLAYGACVKMVRQSRELAKAVRKGTVVERDQDGLICDRTMGYITPLTSQTRHLDGLDVHFCLFDELAACTNRDQYDLIKQGMSARRQPMMLQITTNGFERENLFDDQYDYACGILDGAIEDDRMLPFIYELDDRSEWTDDRSWIKANPGLGTVKSWDYMKDAVNKGMQDPSFLPTLMTKDFNMPESRASAWLTFDEATNDATFDISEMGFRYGIAGFDASDTTDLSAAKMLMMRDGDPNIYVRSMYWIPETVLEESIRKNRDRDDVPYRQWIARGLMRTYPGNKVDKRVFLDWFQEVESELGIYTFAVGFDPWHVDDSTLRDLQAFVGERNCHKVRQGAITLSQPMKQLRAEYQAHHVIDDHNPVNEFCRLNIEIRPDVNGNIQPNKKQNNPKFRIDGFIAELCAYTVMTNVMDEYLDIIKP